MLNISIAHLSKLFDFKTPQLKQVAKFPWLSLKYAGKFASLKAQTLLNNLAQTLPAVALSSPRS